MNELTEFEQANLPLITGYVALKKTIDEYSSQKKKLENELKEQMEKYDIKSIDNSALKATMVAGSESKSVDLKEFKKHEPDEYLALMADYPKKTVRKPSLRITVKK